MVINPAVGTVSVLTPKGNVASFWTRNGTSDSALVGGIIGEDEYGLHELPKLTGWAVDIGAHIGTVAVTLALDNPNLMVVAVEALPENVEMLRANIDLNGVGDRVLVEAAAASSEAEATKGDDIPITYGWSKALNQPDGYMADNRYIGGMIGANETSTEVMCSPLSLGVIVAHYDIDTISLLKIDCEGCEWFFLTSDAVRRCQRIYGEMHIGKHGDAKRLRAMLEPTHHVEMDDSLVVAIFKATRRVRLR